MSNERTLKLTNGNTITLTPESDPRIKDSFIRHGDYHTAPYIRVLTRSIKGARELVKELQAWGAKVDALGERCLVVKA